MACVLIAEDDPLVLRMLSAICRGTFKDLTLLTAGTVEGAISVFRRHFDRTGTVPDILITDLRMPIRAHHTEKQAVKEAGIRLAEMIYKTYPQVPILVLSGILSEESIVQTMEFGAVNVMNKISLSNPRTMKRVLLRMMPSRLFISQEA